jgi:hypothetical protein
LRENTIETLSRDLLHSRVYCYVNSCKLVIIPHFKARMMPTLEICNRGPVGIVRLGLTMIATLSCRILTQEEIAALLDFFLLLNEWDRGRKIM